MTKEEQILLEEIYIERFNHEMDFLTKETANNMYWPRGFLLHPDTARAWFGKEQVSDYGKTYLEYKQEVKNYIHYPIDYQWYGLDLAWGFHLKAMVLLPTISEILAYYGEHGRGK